MVVRTDQQLRIDALAIWKAGVAAVDSRRLIRETIRVDGTWLLIGDEEFDLTRIRRVVVVGAGKAGAGMAAGLEESLGSDLLREKQVAGWVNVPADCVQPLQRITLHAARPAGVNEPTEEGVAGTRRMIDLLRSAHADDLVLCLLSGGGSALMPAPIEGVRLQDKQNVTRLLSGAGANIAQLNTVRKQLSAVKGGRLARHCQARRLVCLIISDVIGDPLDVIASGPTVTDTATPAEALKVLQQFDPQLTVTPEAVVTRLRAMSAATLDEPAGPCEVTNLIIGNNAAAVDAAGIEAERRGYSHAMNAARELERSAEGVGYHLAQLAHRMRETGPDCLISGGEPVVELAPEELRGRGGRNQQLVLAALQKLLRMSPQQPSAALRGIALLSGGTDGEDGPTDAAGAIIGDSLISSMRSANLDPADFLRRNDAYHFFDALGGLLKTGPTHTNVCDLRVVTTSQA